MLFNNVQRGTILANQLDDMAEKKSASQNSIIFFRAAKLTNRLYCSSLDHSLVRPARRFSASPWRFWHDFRTLLSDRTPNRSPHNPLKRKSDSLKQKLSESLNSHGNRSRAAAAITASPKVLDYPLPDGFGHLGQNPGISAAEGCLQPLRFGGLATCLPDGDF